MSKTDPTLRRRGFIGRLASLATGAALAPGMARGATAQAATGEFAVLDQDQSKQTRRLKITRGGMPVACLIFPTDYPTHFRLKPELHQVCTPRGVPVTGTHEYCFIHHQSIMCGHGKVLADGDEHEVDFYRQLPHPDAGRDDVFHASQANHNLFQIGPSGLQHVKQARWVAGKQVVIRLDLEWRKRVIGKVSGDCLVKEVRYYRISGDEGATVVDLFSTLTPFDRPLTLVPENDHGYIGVRVHDLIDVDDGGVMRDSEGRDPNGYFRAGWTEWAAKGPAMKQAAAKQKTGGEAIRRPRWVDCTGKIAGLTAGIALMSHPNNPVNEWYAREFGLIIISGAQSQPVRVTADRPFQFAARFVAHDERLSPEVADRLHAAHAATTTDTLRALLEG